MESVRYIWDTPREIQYLLADTILKKCNCRKTRGFQKSPSKNSLSKYHKSGVASIPYFSIFFLVSTDLSLSAMDIARLYLRRSGVERMFREMKQQIGAFSYHFWSKSMPPVAVMPVSSRTALIMRITSSWAVQ